MVVLTMESTEALLFNEPCRDQSQTSFGRRTIFDVLKFRPVFLARFSNMPGISRIRGPAGDVVHDIARHPAAVILRKRYAGLCVRRRWPCVLFRLSEFRPFAPPLSNG
jgi:hypothetical protein